MDLRWAPGEPRLNILTNRILAGKYRENAESLGVEFEKDPEKAAMFTGWIYITNSLLIQYDTLLYFIHSCNSPCLD